MLIDGEKYACEACVRGHRVSNCQHAGALLPWDSGGAVTDFHADRPLSHINKKGRPVSQCAHCRTLRKSRSAHVKCDCGEKSHAKGTCTHLKDGDKGLPRSSLLLKCNSLMACSRELCLLPWRSLHLCAQKGTLGSSPRVGFRRSRPCTYGQTAPTSCQDCSVRSRAHHLHQRTPQATAEA